MANSYKSLEVEILYARGLENVNHFTKMKPYAVVYMLDRRNNLRSSKKTSSHDAKGVSNPSWNFNVKFNIDIAMARVNSFVLVVKLRSYRKSHCARDKDIGAVFVPITDLTEGAGKRTMTIAVGPSSGENNGADQGKGFLELSYEFNDSTAADLTPLTDKKKSQSELIKNLGKSLGPVVVGGLASGLSSGLVHSALS